MTGKQLRKARQRLGMTLRELGEETGYSEMHIWRMEHGIRRVSLRLVKLLEFMTKKKIYM